MHIIPQGRSATQTNVRFLAAASEPLVTPAASIDWDFLATIDVSYPLTPRFYISGIQDGFPAYEIYIKTAPGMPAPGQSTNVYQWVPPLSRGVESLVPLLDDQPVSTGWGNIQ
jgi:hypothetical protein